MDVGLVLDFSCACLKNKAIVEEAILVPNGKKEIKVNFPEKLPAGVYSNNMMVTHTREEFVMDFLMVTPQGGVVTSRVITSPGHMKRIIAALQDNVRKYEAAHGRIKEAEELKGKIGFQA